MVDDQTAMAGARRAHDANLLAALRGLRRRAAIMALCAVLVPVVSVVISLQQQKQYSATASLLFRDPEFDQKLFGSSVFSTPPDPTREAATNVTLLTLQSVAARVAASLHAGLTPQEVQSKVGVAPVGQSDVVTITATDPRPAFAARLANTFATQFIAFRRDADRSKIASAQQLIQNQLDSMTPAQRNTPAAAALKQRAEQLQIMAALQTGNAEDVQAATVPTSPSSPKIVRNAVIGLVLGITLAVALALLLERLDRRLRDPEEISEAFDRPVLGAIPSSRKIATATMVPGLQPLGPIEAEAFRMLRANLRYFNVDRPVKTVLLTSSQPGDGKSTTSAYLAAAAASADSNVLLLEADLRHPTLARRLGVSHHRGLSQVLAGTVTFDHALSRVPVPELGIGSNAATTLDVLLAGPIPPNPSDLIESERMRDLLQEVSASYDMVVIDTPPLSVVADAIPLVKQVSGVIVVTRLGKSTRESAHHLRERLENLNAHTLGVLVNGITRETPGYDTYGYGYYAAPETGARRSSDPEGADTLFDEPEHATNGTVEGNGDHHRDAESRSVQTDARS